MKRALITEEQNSYFIKIVKNHTTKEIQDNLYKEFGIKLSPKQIQYLKSKNHLKSGIQFMQKGRKPHNYKPIGSEYTNKDGYTFIKIGEKRWERKHKYIYKQYNNISPEETIVFLDQDKTNFNINNLEKIKRSELMNICNNKLLFKNRELSKTGILIQKVINKTKELEKQEML